MTLPLTSQRRRTVRHFARLVRFCLDRHMPQADACALRLVFELISLMVCNASFSCV